MENIDYELLKSMSPEEWKLIAGGDYSPYYAKMKQGNDNPQQEQQPSQQEQQSPQQEPQAQENPYGDMGQEQEDPFGERSQPQQQEQSNPYQNNSMLGNLAAGMASGSYDNVRGIADLIRLKLKERQFGGDPESMAFNIGHPVGKIGSLFAGSGSLGLGAMIAKNIPALGAKIGSWLPHALGVGALGAVTTPGTMGERAGQGALDAALIPGGIAAYKAYKGAKKGIGNAYNNTKYARPENFQKEINQTLDDLFKGKPVTTERENKLVYGEINKNANANRKKASTMYDKNIEEAVNSGYDGVKKKIKIDVNEFINDKRLMRSLRKDSEVSRRFEEFLNEPSFKNAHELQSILNEQSFKLKSPLNDMASQNLGKTFGDTRKKILKAIESTLKENGDTKILTDYQKATKNYAENVVPYIKSKAMRDISNSAPEQGIYNFPGDPLTLLLKNNNRTQKVVSDLPIETKRFLLQKILENAKKGKDSDPVKLKELINDIKSSRKVNLVNKEDLTKLEDLLKQGERLEKTREFIKKNKGKLIVGGIGVPALMGGGKALKSLFSEDK
jgi:hypothetical protein